VPNIEPEGPQESVPIGEKTKKEPLDPGGGANDARTWKTHQTRQKKLPKVSLVSPAAEEGCFTQYKRSKPRTRKRKAPSQQGQVGIAKSQNQRSIRGGRKSGVSACSSIVRSQRKFVTGKRKEGRVASISEESQQVKGWNVGRRG